MSEENAPPAPSDIPRILANSILELLISRAIHCDYIALYHLYRRTNRASHDTNDVGYRILSLLKGEGVGGK
jgi:hypothetical protein